MSPFLLPRCDLDIVGLDSAGCANEDFYSWFTVQSWADDDLDPDEHFVCACDYDGWIARLPRSNERNLQKQEQYFKGKVVTFPIQSLILYQYPVGLLTFFELY